MITDEEYEKLNKSQWRKGQKAFNDLHQTNPDIANEIRGTLADPFYNDSRLPIFQDKVKEIKERNDTSI